MEQTHDTPHDTPVACPLVRAFGKPADQLHDLRPALRVWAGIWTVAAGDTVQTTDELAVILVHLDGPAATAQVGDSMDEVRKLEDGSVLAVTAGLPYRLHFERETRLLGLIFDEALIRMSPLPVIARAPGHYELNAGHQPPPNAIGDIAKVLRLELENEPARPSCRAALIITMLEFVAADTTLVQRSEAASPFSEERIARVIRLIDENISIDMPLDWLAQEAGISPYHLSRTFRDVMGVNISSYVRDRRLKAACRLLAETRKPLAEIAFDCGFSSQSRMTTVFRQMLTTTPLAYRKSCWIQPEARSDLAAASRSLDAVAADKEGDNDHGGDPTA